jgi:hypothetical protein
MIMFASWFTMGEVAHGLGIFQKWEVKTNTHFILCPFILGMPPHLEPLTKTLKVEFYKY